MLNNPVIKHINSLASCDQLVEDLIKAKIIAIDTEFTRVSTYYAKLNLLQICIENNVAYIVDPFLYPDFFERILEAIYNSEGLKVMHSAKNDLEIFYNIKEALPANVFDSQVAYMALSMNDNISYAALVKIFFDLNLDKDLCLSDWNKRPLSNDQLKYAALDVTYLYQIFLKLKKLLVKQKRIKWVEGRMMHLVNPLTYQFNLRDSVMKFARILGLKSNMSILASLLSFRESKAKLHDMPRQRVMKNHIMKYITEQGSQVDFNNIRLTKYTSREEVQSLVSSAHDEFKDYNDTELLKIIYKSRHKLFNLAYKLLRAAATKINVHPSLISNKEEINLYLHDNNVKTSFTEGWKYKAFGSKLESLLRGDIKFKVHDEEIVFDKI